jgi:NADH pyrophosphatase NudC (nudix superfamily)
VESDRRTTASELKVRQADVLRHGQRLEDFKGLDDVVKQVEEIEKSKERATLIARAIEGLNLLLSRKQKAHQTVLKLQGIESIEIPSDEKFLILRNLLKEQGELTALLGRKQHAQQSIQHFEGLDGVQFELNTEQAERILAAIHLVEGLLKRRQVAEVQIRSVEQELNKTEKELVQVTEDLKNLLGNYSECPLCGSALGQHLHGEELCISEDSPL